MAPCSPSLAAWSAASRRGHDLVLIQTRRHRSAPPARLTNSENPPLLFLLLPSVISRPLQRAVPAAACRSLRQHQPRRLLLQLQSLDSLPHQPRRYCHHACSLVRPCSARRSLLAAMGSVSHQTRCHGSHHHHHHDNTYLISADKNDSGVRITRIGLLCNLGMAVAKFVGGWAFNSKSMTADAWHSIADLASDMLTLATVAWSLKPPSDRFPMGFGKIESLGSLGVSGMLLLGGLYMGWESAISLYAHYDPEAAHHILEHVGHGHGHSHSHSAASLGIPSIHAAWLAAGTIMVKEWLYHATIKIARERKSSVLASNAVHHRVDSLTGIVTLTAILGANVLDNAAWLDPVGGLLISIMVVNAGLMNTKAALLELADQSIDDEIKAAVRKQTTLALSDSVSGGHDAQLRQVSGTKSGQNYLIDLEMAVPSNWTVDDMARLENELRTKVGGRVRGARRVRVRFVSRDGAIRDKFDDFIPGSVHIQTEPEPKDKTDRDQACGSERDSKPIQH
ncbi:hypothetical protein XA68_18384 [Ophiocordyceps unilateralis]|uniref:Cation efflux protein transmembrane domain-containing protein n=1 Tax=Ophiocordyceps unilateralis TaxID=268505 RepID=A0A2A9PI08_OPHUN|nr:hypothetical protein XA68_18384 [Ophiocordyceps unilateralis]